MSSLKGLKYLDYAVYDDNIIVPLLLFDTETWFQIDEDSMTGKCRLENRQRKKIKKIKKVGASRDGNR